MAWLDGDLKIFAAGLAVGGEWNSVYGTLPSVTCTPPPGTYMQAQFVTLSCGSANTLIFYSTDQTTPTVQYKGEKIEVGVNLVILAYAVNTSYLSAMGKYAYRIYNPMIVAENFDLRIWGSWTDVEQIGIGGIRPTGATETVNIGALADGLAFTETAIIGINTTEHNV